MKRIYTLIVCLGISGLVVAQPSASVKRSDAPRIKLTNGQKITVESSTDLEASFLMGMAITGSTSSTNALEVKSSNPNNYNIINTLTKLKVNTSGMGQSNVYDSDKKDGNSEEMAKYLDKKMNKQVEVVLDNKTGETTAGKSNDTKANDAEDADPSAGIMKMFIDNSDEAVVASAFEVVPGGKSVGDSWADSTVEKGAKTVRTYTLKSVTGNEGVIQAVITSNGTNKLNFQEMEFELKSETKTNEEIVLDISTGFVKKRTLTSDISGSVQVMGQDMPVSAKVTTTNTYK